MTVFCKNLIKLLGEAPMYRIYTFDELYRALFLLNESLYVHSCNKMYRNDFKF